MPSFSKRSADKLVTCDERLQVLFNEVIKHFDCTVLDGHRNKERQDAAYNSGRSKAKYPQSKHNTYPSMAADVVFYPIDWDSLHRFYEFAGFVKATAIQLGIKIKWGGDFKGFFDGPHFELVE